VLTRVLVDSEDPAFEAPTKPIGPFYTEGRARRLARERGWQVAADAGRGWRRIVPSPKPLRILEVEQVRLLAAAGVLVIAAGGGGIPVARQGRHLTGRDAVIDKDRCAAELALEIEAGLMVFVTGVPRVALGFGTPTAREALRLTVGDALQYLEAGEFPAGSMGPKIESAARFAAEGGGHAVITDAAHLAGAVRGAHGSWIVPDAEGPSQLAPAPVAA
jgi:carbamate kinase